MHPLRAERVAFHVAAGATIFDAIVQAVNAAAVDDRARERLAWFAAHHGHAYLVSPDRGAMEVPCHLWERVRPRPGVMLVVRAAPHGGGGDGGKNPFRVVLGLAVAAAAFAAAGPLGSSIATGLGFAAEGTAAAIATGLVAGAISSVGNLLINQLVPPPQFSGAGGAPDANTVPFLDRSSNRSTLFQAIPKVLGILDVAPVNAIKPYTRVQGDEQFLYLVLTVGHGDVEIANIRIGDTAVDLIPDLEIELRHQGDDTPLTLVDSDVNEKQLDIVIEPANPDTDGSEGRVTREPVVDDANWFVQAAGDTADRLEVDLTFFGLLTQDDAGAAPQVCAHHFEVQYRPAGGTSWLAPDFAAAGVRLAGAFADTTTPGGETAGNVRVQRATQDFVRATVAWPVSRGSYEVRVRSVGAFALDTDTGQSVQTTTNFINTYTRVFADAKWSAVRAVKHDSPIKRGNLGLIAMRVPRSEQYSGSLPTVVCEARSRVPTWDGTAWSGVAVSRNPAALALEVLRDTAGSGVNPKPQPDSAIDLASFGAWYAFCEGRGFEYNRYIRRSTRIETLLQEIEAAGRAKIAKIDGVYTAVIEQDQATPTQLFTPINARGFTITQKFVEPPHAVRVEFPDQDNGYEARERIVYWDWFSASNATNIQKFDLPGITRDDLVYMHARYHLASLWLRPRTFSFSTDWEYMAVRRGDRARVQHDAIAAGVGSARVVAIAGATLTLSAALPLRAGVDYGILIRNVAGQEVTALDPVASDGDHDQVTLTATPAIAPEIGDLVAIGELGKEAVDVLVTAIKPDRDGGATITAIDYSPAVYQADQGEVPPFDAGINAVYRPSDTDRGKLLAPVIEVWSGAAATRREGDGRQALRVQVAFTLPSVRGGLGVASLQVEVRRTSDGHRAIVPGDPDAATVPVEGVEVGDRIALRGRYVLTDGTASPWSGSIVHTVTADTTQPRPVTNLAWRRLPTGAEITWDQPDDALWSVSDVYVERIDAQISSDPTFADALAKSPRASVKATSHTLQFVQMSRAEAGEALILATGPELGISDADFVENLYAKWLQRASDAAGKQFWVDELAAGKTRVIVERDFLSGAGPSGSQELSDSAYITRVSELFIGRAPTADELDAWLAELQKPLKGRVIVKNEFLGSATVKEGIADEGYIVTCFNVYADRPPTTAELQDWTARVAVRGDTFRVWVVSRTARGVRAAPAGPIDIPVGSVRQDDLDESIRGQVLGHGREFRVSAFGAALDDASDDTAAVQAAIDAAAAAGGGHVIVDGTARVDTVSHTAVQGLPRILRLDADNVHVEVPSGAHLRTTADAALFSVGGVTDRGDIHNEPLYDMEHPQDPGSTAVTLLNDGDTDNFEIGDIVYIRTGELLQYSGSNHPDAEWNVVKSKQTGLLQLQFPLEKPYAPETFPAGHPQEGEPAPFAVQNASRPAKLVTENIAIYGGGALIQESFDRPVLEGNQILKMYFGGGLTIRTIGVGFSMGATDSLFENFRIFSERLDVLRVVSMDKGNTRSVWRDIEAVARGVCTVHIHEGASAVVRGVRLLSRGVSGSSNVISLRARPHNVTISDVDIVGSSSGPEAVFHAPDGRGLLIDQVRVRGQGNNRVRIAGRDAQIGRIDTPILNIGDTSGSGGGAVGQDVQAGDAIIQVPVASFAGIGAAPTWDDHLVKYPAWVFAAGADQAIGTQVFLPRLTGLRVRLLWLNAGVTDTGPVRWRVFLRALREGRNLNIGFDHTGALTSQAAPATSDMLVTEVRPPSGTVQAGDWINLTIQRNGTHTDDTLGDPIALIGVMIWRDD